MSRDFEAIMRGTISNETDITKNEVISLPPGYLVGFDVRLRPDYTVVVSAGAANVGGSLVKKSSDHQLEEADWVLERYNADRHFYIYLTKDGSFKVDIIAPVWNDGLLYYEHPTLQWRAIGKMFVAGGNIVFGIKEVEKTEQTVTVAPHGFTGKADYYCNHDSPYGNCDEIIINAATRYVHEAYDGGEVHILAGDYYLSPTIISTSQGVILYDHVTLSGDGSGTVIHRPASTTGMVWNSLTSELNDITIRGIKFYQALTDTSRASCFKASQLHNSTISECYFYGFRTRVVYIDAGSIDSSSITITKNRFDYCCHCCIYVNGGDSGSIDGNIIDGHSWNDGSAYDDASISCYSDTITVIGNSVSNLLSANEIHGIYSVGSTVGNKVSNIEVTGSNWSVGIYGGLVVSGNIIDTVKNSSDNTWSEGIDGGYAITGNFIKNCLGCGIYVIAGAEVTGNQIICSDSETYDISGIIVSDSGNVVSGNTISGISTASDAYGIYVSSGTINNTITGNVISDLSSTASLVYGINIQGNHEVVSGNAISDLSSPGDIYGIYLGLWAFDNVIDGNNISTLNSSASDPCGIYSNSTDGRNTIFGNTISDLDGDKAYGIQIDAGPHTTISNNSIYDVVGSSDDTGVEAAEDYCLISDNRVEACDALGIYIGGTGNKITNNYCYNNGSDTGIANTNEHNFNDDGIDTQIYSNSWQQPVANEFALGELHQLYTIPTSTWYANIECSLTIISVTCASFSPVGTRAVEFFCMLDGDYEYLITSKYTGCTCTGAYTNMTMRNNNDNVSTGARVPIFVDSDRKFYMRSWDPAGTGGDAGTHAMFSPIGYYL